MRRRMEPSSLSRVLRSLSEMGLGLDGWRGQPWKSLSWEAFLKFILF